MKWAVGLIAAVGGGAIVAACLTMDPAGAAVFAFATIVVVTLGAAPIVFSAWSRRAAERSRRTPPPRVIPRSPERATPARPTSRRARAHRRPKG